MTLSFRGMSNLAGPKRSASVSKSKLNFFCKKQNTLSRSIQMYTHQLMVKALRFASLTRNYALSPVCLPRKRTQRTARLTPFMAKGPLKVRAAMWPRYTPFSICPAEASHRCTAVRGKYLPPPLLTPFMASCTCFVPLVKTKRHLRPGLTVPPSTSGQPSVGSLADSRVRRA